MKKRIGRFFLYLILCIVSFLSIFPFIWMIIGATNDSLSILRGKLTFGDQLVNNFTLLFRDHDMLRIFGNSLKISSITEILILIITSMAAYGFQIFASKGKERLYGVFLLTMMVPFATLMIPLFQIFAKMQLLNSHFAVIIVSAASVFMVFFFRQSFANYPKDILQAARVDGAGELRIFTNIFVPSMKNTYFAAAIYAFMTSWNLYLWPLVVLGTNEKKTTTLLLSSLSSSYTPEYGTIMIGIVISTLPIIIVFFAFQKQFVEGMLGSVKQ
jgi:lactose/L-arabinose transport system permease protein